MTLVALEGFDWTQWNVTNYDTKNWLFAFTQLGGMLWTPSASAGRVVGHSVRFDAPADQVVYYRLQKILPSVLTHVVTGFGLFYTQSPDISRFASVYTLTTDGGADIVHFGPAADGSLYFATAYGSGAITSSATGLITPGAWNYIELKIVINGASSSVGCHLNGVEVIAPFTCNLGSTGAQYIGPFGMANDGWSSGPHGGFGVAVFYDDMYVFDSSVGATNTDYVGDVHVETLFPNGAGTHTDWTPDTGVNYTRVNEKTGTFPDGDASYVKTITAGNEDSYAYDDLTITSGTIYGVQTNLYARKEDTNLRQLYPIIVRSGTTYVGSSLFTLANGYVDGTEIFEQDPSTSSAWTVSGVNAAEFGVKVQT